MKYLKIKGNTVSLLYFSVTLLFFTNYSYSQVICNIGNQQNVYSSAKEEYSGLAYSPNDNVFLIPMDSPSGGFYIKGYKLEDNETQSYAFNVSVKDKFNNSVNFTANDFEGLTYLEDDFFALIEEDENMIYFFRYLDNSNTLKFINSVPTGISLGTNSKMDGLEGITYDPHTNRLFFVREHFSRELFSKEVVLPTTNTDGSLTGNLSSVILPSTYFSNRFYPTDTQFTIDNETVVCDQSHNDASGIHHLGQNFDEDSPFASNILVLSEGNKKIVEFEIEFDNSNNMTLIYQDEQFILNEPQPEGITVVDDKIYIASEAGCPEESVSLSSYLINGNTACAEPCNVPDADDGCSLTTDSFDAANCQVINQAPDVDDGCSLTTDSFDQANCKITNVPNCPANSTFNSNTCSCIVMGCTDPCATNFDTNATEDDGSCATYDTICNADCTVGDVTQWDSVSCECKIIERSGCTNTNACNYDSSATCNDGSCEYNIILDLKIYLEGPYNPSLQKHSTALNTVRKLLPGQTPSSNLVDPTPVGQPYNVAPWYYAGTEGANFTEADYLSTDVDWVLVSLRTEPNLNSEFRKVAGILQEDGSIRFLECITYPITFHPSYIVVEHRNHLSVMSKNLVAPSNYYLTYDFTAGDSFRTCINDNECSSFGQKQLPTGEWVAYGGNADQSSTTLDRDDTNGKDKSIWFDTNGTFDHYLNGDFNLNGDINGADKTIWFDNNGISTRVNHPGIE